MVFLQARDVDQPKLHMLVGKGELKEFDFLAHDDHHIGAT